VRYAKSARSRRAGPPIQIGEVVGGVTRRYTAMSWSGLRGASLQRLSLKVNEAETAVDRHWPGSPWDSASTVNANSFLTRHRQDKMPHPHRYGIFWRVAAWDSTAFRRHPRHLCGRASGHRHSMNRSGLESQFGINTLVKQNHCGRRHRRPPFCVTIDSAGGDRRLWRFDRGVAARLVAAAVFKTVGAGKDLARWVRFPSTPAISNQRRAFRMSFLRSQPRSPEANSYAPPSCAASAFI
jgi:hypothetical protein